MGNFDYKVENQSGGQNKILDPKVIDELEAVDLKGFATLNNGIGETLFAQAGVGLDLSLSADSESILWFLGGKYHRGLGNYFYCFYESDNLKVWFGCVTDSSTVVELGYIDVASGPPNNATFIEFRDSMLISVPGLHIYRAYPSSPKLQMFGTLEYANGGGRTLSATQVVSGGSLPAGTYKALAVWAKKDANGNILTTGRCREDAVEVSINANDQITLSIGAGWADAIGTASGASVSTARAYSYHGITDVIFYMAAPSASLDSDASVEYDIKDDIYLRCKSVSFGNGTLSTTITSLSDFDVNPEDMGVWSGSFDLYNPQCYDNVPPAGNKLNTGWDNNPIEIVDMAYNGGRIFYGYEDNIYFTKSGNTFLNECSPNRKFLGAGGEIEALFSHKGDVIVSTDTETKVLYNSEPLEVFWYWDESSSTWRTQTGGDSLKSISEDFGIESKSSIIDYKGYTFALTERSGFFDINGYDAGEWTRQDFLLKLGQDIVNDLLNNTPSNAARTTAFIFRRDTDAYYMLVSNGITANRTEYIVGFNLSNGGVFWGVLDDTWLPLGGTEAFNKHYTVTGKIDGKGLEMRELVTDSTGPFRWQSKTRDFDNHNIRPRRLKIDFTYSGTY